MQGESVVALFTRYSKSNAVKRRLAAQTNEQVALATHRFLLERILAVLEKQKQNYQIWVAGDSTALETSDPLLALQVDLHAQRGSSLGERMAEAIRFNCARGYLPLVIGGDCPIMHSTYLDSAHTALIEGADLVIGPAEDGGYVLIGMHQLHEPLFENISWGGDKVLKQTLEVARKLKLKVHLLETLWDVDRSEDLVRMAALNLPNPPVALIDYWMADRREICSIKRSSRLR